MQSSAPFSDVPPSKVFNDLSQFFTEQGDRILQEHSPNRRSNSGEKVAVTVSSKYLGARALDHNKDTLFRNTANGDINMVMSKPQTQGVPLSKPQRSLSQLKIDSDVAKAKANRSHLGKKYFDHNNGGKRTQMALVANPYEIPGSAQKIHSGRDLSSDYSKSQYALQNQSMQINKETESAYASSHTSQLGRNENSLFQQASKKMLQPLPNKYVQGLSMS